MEKLTHSQLLEILRNRKGAFPVSIIALTDAKALKTGNPFPEKTVMKQVAAVSFTGASYENAVKKEGQRQGVTGTEDFETGSLPWGEWEIVNKVIRHKGEFYLRLQTTPGQRQRQKTVILAFRDVAGKFLSRDEVKPFLPAKKAQSVKQSEAGLEGREKQIQPVNYKFSSIRKIKVDGTTYELIPD